MPRPSMGCPGSQAQTFAASAPAMAATSDRHEQPQLSQWPVQLHLVPPTAPFFAEADVLLSADCVAYALGGFHGRFLRGRSLAIACPKLDAHQEVYVGKLVALIDEAAIRSLTIMVMEVPCCGGLVRLAQEALSRAQRTIPTQVLVVGLRGDILGEHQVA
jgi:hypothetical protein